MAFNSELDRGLENTTLFVIACITGIKSLF